MKRCLIITTLFLLVFCNLVYGKAGTPKSVEKKEPYKAFIVFEPITGKAIDGKDIHLKRAPASITKLMLTYVVMERLSRGEVKITDTITVSKEASRMGGSQVYLKEGETFSLEEMMKAILVASANDAAYAVAEHIAGTPEGFVQMMNEKAKEIGMVDSEFNTVHGLPPSKGQKEDATSCSDLALLAKAIINKYPKVIEWTSISQEGFRDGKFIMNNHNKLLLKMPGIVDGLKTGYYGETGYNIVATGKRDRLRVIVVILGSPSAKIRDDVAIGMFKTAFSRLKMVDIVKKGEVIDKDIVLVDGKYRKIKGIAATGLSYPIFKDKKAVIKREYVIPERIKGEVREGQRLGELLIKVDNETIGKIDIVSPVYVPKANLFTRCIRRIGLDI